MPRPLPASAPLAANRRSILESLNLESLIRPSPVCEKAEPRRGPARDARLFRSPAGRARLLRTRIRTYFRSAGDQSIGVPTDATLVVAGRRNFGTSKSDTHAAQNSVARIADRSACPVQPRHR